MNSKKKKENKKKKKENKWHKNNFNKTINKKTIKIILFSNNVNTTKCLNFQY